MKRPTNGRLAFAETITAVLRDLYYLDFISRRELARGNKMTITTTIRMTGQRQMGQQLVGLERCPHCNIAVPQLSSVWASDGPTRGTDGGRPIHWGCYICTSCGSLVLAKANLGPDYFIVSKTYPEARSAHEDIPPVARQFLQQAYNTLHAPDAAAVMAGSAVDAMLKHHNYIDGSLYSRIDKALDDNLLTKGMADWAHAVRLGSNRPRHADAESPHVSAEEARQSVDFAEALGNFLFVLTSRIERGLAATQQEQ